VTILVIVVLAVVAAALAFQLVSVLRRLAPLETLIEEMEKVDLSTPGPLPDSIDGVGETEEVARIELAFLRMMRRLEAERRRAGSAALHAQEEERARVARDLHDEVNQPRPVAAAGGSARGGAARAGARTRRDPLAR
jgi:two-component system, NarL family, sensor histidine kinase UhpB